MISLVCGKLSRTKEQTRQKETHRYREQTGHHAWGNGGGEKDKAE